MIWKCPFPVWSSVETDSKDFEQIELGAKLLDYFLRSNKSNINQKGGRDSRERERIIREQDLFPHIPGTRSRNTNSERTHRCLPSSPSTGARTRLSPLLLTAPRPFFNQSKESFFFVASVVKTRLNHFTLGLSTGPRFDSGRNPENSNPCHGGSEQIDPQARFLNNCF